MAAVTPIIVTDDPDVVQQPIVDRKMHNEAPAEDADLVRSGRLKVDLLVLSCIILMFIFLQFDRTSLGQALTDNFRQIAGVSTQNINTGQTLFTLAFVLFEIPANVAIKRFGVHRWLPALMFAWGTVTWCQMFITSRSGFYATRFLLAACEAGFIPGAAFYLGQFYSRKEMAFRYALLWSANGIAGAIAGVLALGLLSLSGNGGLFGWQWLFLIEGVLTCAIAVFAALHLPQSPHDATRHRLFGRRFAILSEAEAEALSSRAVRDDPTKASQSSRKVALRDFDILIDWRFYGHAVSAFLSSIMFTPINTYGPSIIKSLGFAGYTANGLSSVGSVMVLIVSLSLAWNSDRTRERGLHIMTGFLISGRRSALASCSSQWCGKGNPLCGHRGDAGWYGFRAGHQCSLALGAHPGAPATRRAGRIRHVDSAGLLCGIEHLHCRRRPALQQGSVHLRRLRVGRSRRSRCLEGAVCVEGKKGGASDARCL